MDPKIPGVYGASNKGPLILLFSPHERIRDILTVGLIQCNYQVIQASSSFIAAVKATQLLPGMVIADLSSDNYKDILLAIRLHRSFRTRDMRILLILPKDPHKFILKILAELADIGSHEGGAHISTIEYPFAFADLLQKVQGIIESVSSITYGAHVPESNRITETRILDMSTPVAKKLNDIEQLLHRQWAFPFTVIRAFDILESESSCCNELATCISTDPAVSSAILRVANTVYYARRDGRITDLKDAVVRLGFRETRNLLACLSLIDLSPDIYKNRGFGRREFWLHSLSVAVIAEKICRDCGFHKPEYGFVAGLLHDLGKIPLDNLFETLFARVLDETITSMGPFHAAERKLTGFTHAELGHYLTNRWNFSTVVGQAILNHHSKDRILANYSILDRILQEAVFVGNLLAKAVGMGHSCDEILESIPNEIMQDLKLGAGPGDRFFTFVYQQVSILCQFLNLTMDEMPVARPLSESGDCQIIVVYENKTVFHPVVFALRNNGFLVNVTGRQPSGNQNGRVIIIIPERGVPLDIVLDDNPGKGVMNKDLRIFLVPLDIDKKLRPDQPSSDIIFMDSNTVDYRVLMHIIDKFLGRIIAPETGSKAQPVQNDDTRLTADKNA